MVILFPRKCCRWKKPLRSFPTIKLVVQQRNWPIFLSSGKNTLENLAAFRPHICLKSLQVIIHMLRMPSPDQSCVPKPHAPYVFSLRGQIENESEKMSWQRHECLSPAQSWMSAGESEVENRRTTGMHDFGWTMFPKVCILHRSPNFHYEHASRRWWMGSANALWDVPRIHYRLFLFCFTSFLSLSSIKWSIFNVQTGIFGISINSSFSMEAGFYKVVPNVFYSMRLSCR